MIYDPTQPGLSTGQSVLYGGAVYTVLLETSEGVLAARKTSASSYLKRSVDLLPHAQVEAV